MSLDAFQPQGNTVLIAATSSTGVAPTQLSTGNVMGCRLANPTTVLVYVAIGSSTVQAAAPTTAAPALGMPLQPSQPPQTFNFSPSLASNWLSAITTGGSGLPGILATPGFGIN